MRTNLKDLPGSIISGQKKIVFNAGFEAYREYGESKDVFSHKIQLIFSPFGLPFVPIEVVGDDTGKIISDLTWTKDRNNPGGILNCTIVPDPEMIAKIVSTFDKFSGNLYSKIWGSLGVELEDLFKPMTLCQLWIDGYHVMMGYVRACQRSSSVTNDSKDVSYALTIEELGNIFNLGSIDLANLLQSNLQRDLIDNLQKTFAISSDIKGVSVAAGMTTILNTFRITTLESSINLSDGFPLAYRLLALNNPLGAIANNSIANQMIYDDSMFKLNSSGGSQSVWSFMQSFMPSPWMEFFTESGGRTIVTDSIGAPAVLFPGFSYPVARTVPYSNVLHGIVNPKWWTHTVGLEINALQMIAGGDFVIVTDDMIMEKELGVDSINQSTSFRTNYANKGVVTSYNQSVYPIRCPGPLNPFASGGIRTFGEREMITQIDSTSVAGLGAFASIYDRLISVTGLPGVKLAGPELSNLLAVWFRNQSRFREGTITCRGIPYARAGMYCLYLPSISGKKAENIRDIGVYYIDSLTHSYSLNNDSMQFTTTLNVIRGTPLPDNIGKTLLLLFDWETLPPVTGEVDGEYSIAMTIRKTLSKQVSIPGI